MRFKRQPSASSLLLFLVTTCHQAVAFVPRNHLPVFLQQQSESVFRVDALVQLEPKPPHREGINGRRRSILTQDRDTKRHIHYHPWEIDERELQFIGIKQKLPETGYKLMPKDQQKKKKKSKKPSKMICTSSTQEQQPAWILHWKAAQQDMEKVKHSIHQRINEPVVECSGAVLILLSSLLVAITTLPNLPNELLAPVETIQELLACLFFVEFLTRWFSSSETQGRYVTQPLVLVDVVVVVLPLLLPLLDAAAFFPIDLGHSREAAALINLRLLRVLRLQRVLQDEMTFSKFVSAVRCCNNPNSNSSIIVHQWELQLARVLLSIFTLLSVAAGLIYTTEHAVNPNIDDYFTALYFTLTTLTTVGFGDITPMTWHGKLVVSGSILAGITMIPVQAATLVEALLQRGEQEEEQQQQQTILMESPANAQTQKPDNMASALEATRKCPTCHVGLHWAHATYCYNCASPLLSTEATKNLVLPDCQS